MTDDLRELLSTFGGELLEKAVNAAETKVLPGTITQIVSDTNARVVIDGSTVAVETQNTAGSQLAVGARVLVLFFPPHGAVILGPVVANLGPGGGTVIPTGPDLWRLLVMGTDPWGFWMLNETGWVRNAAPLADEMRTQDAEIRAVTVQPGIAPVAEIYDLTDDGGPSTTGTFTLTTTVGGTTTPLAFNATKNDIQAAIVALVESAFYSVFCSGPPMPSGPVRITLTPVLGQPVTLLSVDSSGLDGSDQLIEIQAGDTGYPARAFFPVEADNFSDFAPADLGVPAPFSVLDAPDAPFYEMGVEGLIAASNGTAIRFRDSAAWAEIPATHDGNDIGHLPWLLDFSALTVFRIETFPDGSLSFCPLLSRAGEDIAGPDIWFAKVEGEVDPGLFLTIWTSNGTASSAAGTVQTGQVYALIVTHHVEITGDVPAGVLVYAGEWDQFKTYQINEWVMWRDPGDINTFNWYYNLSTTNLGIDPSTDAGVNWALINPTAATFTAYLNGVEVLSCDGLSSAGRATIFRAYSSLDAGGPNYPENGLVLVGDDVAVWSRGLTSDEIAVLTLAVAP